MTSWSTDRRSWSCLMTVRIIPNITDVRNVDQANCLPKLSLLWFTAVWRLHRLFPDSVSLFRLLLFHYFLNLLTCVYGIWRIFCFSTNSLQTFFSFVKLLIHVSSYQQFLLQGDPLSNVPSTHVIFLATKYSFLSLIYRFLANITHCFHHNLKLY